MDAQTSITNWKGGLDPGWVSIQIDIQDLSKDQMQLLFMIHRLLL